MVEIELSHVTLSVPDKVLHAVHDDPGTRHVEAHLGQVLSDHQGTEVGSDQGVCLEFEIKSKNVFILLTVLAALRPWTSHCHTEAAKTFVSGNLRWLVWSDVNDDVILLVPSRDPVAQLRPALWIEETRTEQGSGQAVLGEFLNLGRELVGGKFVVTRRV